jgi:hypothetical protein
MSILPELPMVVSLLLMQLPQIMPSLQHWLLATCQVCCGCCKVAIAAHISTHLAVDVNELKF